MIIIFIFVFVLIFLFVIIGVIYEKCYKRISLQNYRLMGTNNNNENHIHYNNNQYNNFNSNSNTNSNQYFNYQGNTNHWVINNILKLFLRIIVIWIIFYFLTIFLININFIF